MDPYVDLSTHYESKVSIDDAAVSGTAVTGTAIDCRNYSGPIHCLFHTGAATGSPTAQAHPVKLQESADGSTGWQDLATQTNTTMTADAQAKMVRGIRTLRYVRAHADDAFTGGTSPATTISAVIMGRLTRAT